MTRLKGPATLQLNLMTTTKCNYACKHCMFACTSRGTDMTTEVARAALRFAANNDLSISEIDFYGGEPFLNIEQFKTIYDTVKESATCFFVSTNGSWLPSRKKRAYVFGELIADWRHRCQYESDMTSIRISHSAYHDEFHVRAARRWLQLIDHYRSEDWAFYEDHPDMEFNPFCDTYTTDSGVKNRNVHWIYLDRYVSTTDPMNPTGRAVEHCHLNTRPASCALFSCFAPTGEIFFAQEEENVSLHVAPNGDVSICCYCESGVVGNLLEEPFLTLPTIRARATLLKDKLIQTLDLPAYRAQPSMEEVCPQCTKYRVTKEGKLRRKKHKVGNYKPDVSPT